MDTVYFWKPESPNGYLSNWYESQFYLPNDSNKYSAKLRVSDEYYFRTSEHAMMWRKALLMGDHTTANTILKTINPAIVKKLGRQVKPWNEHLWNTQREQIMYECCLAKFTQNKELKKELLATGEAMLVEASPYDSIWGIGITEREARSGVQSKGLNLLGKALMKVRGDIQ